MTKTSDLARLEDLRQELLRAFRFWNGRYWAGALPLPVITFNPQTPRSNRLAHHAAKAWRPADHRRRAVDEIVLYSDLCLGREITEVLATFLHEMGHLWQAHYGAPSDWYHHNREWHREANRVGLATTKGDYRGATTPDGEFRAAVREFRPAVARTPQRDVGRAPGKLRKWSCACGYGVRVAIANFRARCLVCGRVFRPAASRW